MMNINEKVVVSSDVSYKTENEMFNYRVGGVVLHDSKILLTTEDHLDFWYLPGGRVRLFESSEKALQREITEEFFECAR